MNGAVHRRLRLTTHLFLSPKLERRAKNGSVPRRSPMPSVTQDRSVEIPKNWLELLERYRLGFGKQLSYLHVPFAGQWPQSHLPVRLVPFAGNFADLKRSENERAHDCESMKFAAISLAGPLRDPGSASVTRPGVDLLFPTLILIGSVWRSATPFALNLPKLE